MSDNYDTLLIESYREQSAALRQDDSMLHRMTAIILPVSTIALFVGFYKPEIPILLPLLGGVILMTFWIILCHVLYISIYTRLAIMNKIEEHWEIPGYKHFPGIRAEIFGTRPKWLYKWFGIYRGAMLYRAGYIVHLVIALLVYLWKKGYLNLNSDVISHLLDIILPFEFVILMFLVLLGVVALWFMVRITERSIKTCKSPTLECVGKLLARKK